MDKKITSNAKNPVEKKRRKARRNTKSKNNNKH